MDLSGLLRLRRRHRGLYLDLQLAVQEQNWEAAFEAAALAAKIDDRTETHTRYITNVAAIAVKRASPEVREGLHGTFASNSFTACRYSLDVGEMGPTRLDRGQRRRRRGGGREARHLRGQGRRPGEAVGGRDAGGGRRRQEEGGAPPALPGRDARGRRVSQHHRGGDDAVRGGRQEACDDRDRQEGCLGCGGLRRRHDRLPRRRGRRVGRGRGCQSRRIAPIQPLISVSQAARRKLDHD